MLTWALCDLNGRVIEMVDERQPGGQVTVTLNGPRRGSLSLSFDDPAARHVGPLLRVVKVWLDGEPLCNGHVTKPRYSVRDRQIVIPFQDPSRKLERAQINNRGDTDFESPSTLFPAMTSDPDYSGTATNIGPQDQSEILVRLMEHAYPTPAEIALGVPGHGIIRGTLPPSITRDRVYEDGAQVWQMMANLCAVREGVDMQLTPIDRMDGVLCQLDTFYPFQGGDLTGQVVFEIGHGLDNAADLVWEPAGDEVVNRWTTMGESEEGDPPNLWQANQAESQLLFGIYAHWEGREDVVFTTTLEQIATEQCAARAFPENVFQVTPAMSDGTGRARDTDPSSQTFGTIQRMDGRFAVPPRFGPGPQHDYWLGDFIAVKAVDRPVVELEETGRVYEAVLTEDADGAVLTEIKVTPSTIDVVAV